MSGHALALIRSVAALQDAPRDFEPSRERPLCYARLVMPAIAEQLGAFAGAFFVFEGGQGCPVGTFQVFN